MPFLLQCFENRVKVFGRRIDLVGFAVVLKVVGACFYGKVHQRIFIRLRGIDNDIALLFEHPRDTSRLTHVSAVLGKQVPDLTHGAIPVVRNDIDDDCNSARTVSLVRDLVELSAVELAGALHDGPLDIVGRHVEGFRVGDGFAQARVAIGIASAEAGGDGDFLDELCEGAAPL